MRVGLARLMNHFKRNQIISKLIESTLYESEYTYIPEVSLLWRHKGRFAIEYFWHKSYYGNYYQLQFSSVPKVITRSHD